MNVLVFFRNLVSRSRFSLFLKQFPYIQDYLLIPNISNVFVTLVSARQIITIRYLRKSERAEIFKNLITFSDDTSRGTVSVPKHKETVIISKKYNTNKQALGGFQIML